MSERRYRIVSSASIPADTRRGGELRTVLSPKTVGSTSGFMGVATLAPEEAVAEHFHPWSEEFLFVVEGSLVVELDGRRYELPAQHGLVVPPRVKHRLRNEGTVVAVAVYHLGPLAPSPELGHVDTEAP